VWHFAQGAREPLRLGVADTLEWQPLAGGPVLRIPVEQIFGSVERS
jgi:hypothetical protein